MKKNFLVFIAAILLIGLATLILSLSLALTSYRSLKQANFSNASSQAKIANYLVTPLSKVTLHLIPDLETYRLGLQMISQANSLTILSQQYSQHIFEPAAQTDAAQIKKSFTELATTELQFKEYYRRSYFISRLTNPDTFTKYDSMINETNYLVQSLLSGQQQYLLILQNSQELRATGGFMGTYAKISLTDGQITELKIQDIYEPDGQFTGYVVAPPGVAEYLSSGKGLRLPDSNWHPDFPTSARQILDFFALGKKEQLKGVVAVNLTLGENLLNIIGPIFLPDYQITVDAQNLAQVARSDRDKFFPGSQQKPDFFSHLFTQLKLKLNELTPTQQREIAKLLLKSITNKDVQFFATDYQSQQLIAKYNLGGQLLSSDQAPSFYLVESNVGINKANQAITREVNINLNDYRTTIQINFHNLNEKNSNDLNSNNDYINYQRLILPAEYSVFQITVGQQKIDHFDETMIENSQGEKFKQIGFLVAVPTQQTKNVTLELTTNHIYASNQQPSIFIQKQPGLPATPYLITYADKSKNILLEEDSLVTF